MEAPLGLRSTYLSTGQITITNTVPFPKTRQLPISWRNLTVILPDTETYNKTLLFYESMSGKVTALVDTGNIWVDSSLNHTSENRSSFSPI